MHKNTSLQHLVNIELWLTPVVRLGISLCLAWAAIHQIGGRSTKWRTTTFDASVGKTIMERTVNPIHLCLKLSFGGMGTNYSAITSTTIDG